ncbi:rnapii degradation factor [Sporothrix schenckii 1099-18]|uniref:RNA polymerase II degradation factor 1 n=2 Tax=Sporothrix schenckii TaxID=29908 RepID=U7Q0G0_SPOS1|nr:rnapii degradation factor [Sporothrix schenckii 1099-18]ERT00672.1 hypothetical protein HMPREF1624_01902 [Sporothrix schenckii ATCC 58251]KJR87744.1 rnapii degradation factor [Sporothrix schenckii 1099-18]
MSSEVQSRPAATRGGRGAARGGRGGFAGRGSTRRTNGDAKNDDSSPVSLEDEGEIGQLKKLYGAKTSLIRELFPDWSEVDVLFALRETDGDENLTVTRIAEGTISQWDEVSKPKKERTKPKAATADAAAARPARREGAGPDKTRGRANARAVERGGRSARGRSAPASANGTRTDAPLSVPTEESQAWDGQKPADESTPEPTAAAAAAHTTSAAPTSAPTAAAAVPKTWASMLRQTVVPLPKAAAKPKEAAHATKAPTDIATDSLPPSTSTAAPTTAPSSAPTGDAEPESATAEDTPVVKEAAALDVAIPVVVPEVAILPSKDALTESNLEQVDDDSHPPETDTLHSEAADSWDPRAAALAGTSTPISASQQQHAGKPAAVGSGYATTASKATDRGAVRTPSYSRRILDQEEAVRMPVNRDVDRAAVQFGALNFNGADNEDIDGDREEPETRAQPPDDSPVAHPRASLPPVAPPASVPDAFAAQKQAAANATPTATSTLPSAPGATAPVAPPTGPAAQAQNAQPYGRYGQAAQDSAFGQKPFDTYGQPAQPQASAASQFDNYQSIPTTANTQAPQAPTAYSSAAPNEYSQYFTSDAQSRMPQYNNYYQAYGQQAQGHQDGAQNQRSYGAYDSLSQYPQSSGASRFGGAAAATSTAAADAQNSGTSTPNPPVAGQPQSQQQPGAGAQGQHGQQQHQNNQYQSYSQHPYYASPYYAQYVQYGAFGGQSNFGTPYGGKGGYGGAHHPYNMNPQYDQHSQSSGGFGGASSLHRGAGADNTGLGSAGLSDYGRVASSNQSQTGFGGAGATGHDGTYGRGGASGYQSQAAGQGYGAQQSQVGSQQTGADDLKPYGDASKAAGAGPNPSGLARPGSATNTQSSQSLPPPQSAQQGAYSGYPSHLQHGAGGLHGNNQSAAGGAGGYGGNQNHGNNPYISAYGGHNAQHGGHAGQGFGSNYYSNQQQQRGWGGNYH